MFIKNDSLYNIKQTYDPAQRQMRGFEAADELPEGEKMLKPRDKQFFFLKRICSEATHQLDVPHTVELRRKPKEELLRILKQTNLKPETFKGYDVELKS